MIRLVSVVALAFFAGGFASRPSAAADLRQDTDEEQLMHLMRSLKDADDPAGPLRSLRQWQLGARLDAGMVRKYTRRFIRKDEDLALASQLAALGDRDGQLVSLDELVRLASHDQPAIRETAVWSLGVRQIESPEALAVLEHGMRDEAPVVRETACWAAGNIQGEVPFPHSRLAGTPTVSANGIIVSGSLAIGGGAGSTRITLFRYAGKPMTSVPGRPHHWRRSLEWSQEENLLPEPRDPAAIRRGLVSLVPALEKALRDEVPKVADTALWALANSGPHAAGLVSELAVALKDVGEWRSDLAAWALGRMGPAALPVVDELKARVGLHGGVMGAFAIVVALAGDERDQLLMEALEGDDLLVIEEACYILAQQPSVPSEELLGPLASSFLAGNYLAIEPLARFGPRAEDYLLVGLESPTADVRGIAACALARHGGRDALGALGRIAAADTDPDVQKAASEAAAAIEARTER